MMVRLVSSAFIPPCSRLLEILVTLQLRFFPSILMPISSISITLNIDSKRVTPRPILNLSPLHSLLHFDKYLLVELNIWVLLGASPLL